MHFTYLKIFEIKVSTIDAEGEAGVYFVAAMTLKEHTYEYDFQRCILNAFNWYSLQSWVSNTYVRSKM